MPAREAGPARRGRSWGHALASGLHSHGCKWGVAGRGGAALPWEFLAPDFSPSRLVLTAAQWLACYPRPLSGISP